MLRPVVVMSVLLLATPALAQATPEQKERARTVAKACQADARKFCQGIQPGGGRLLACLKGHGAELSAACRNMLNGDGQ